MILRTLINLGPKIKYITRLATMGSFTYNVIYSDKPKLGYEIHQRFNQEENK
jgi:hypothetical protein